MLKRYLEKSSWDDKDISKPLAQILEAMEAVQDVYPCIQEIKQSIVSSKQQPQTNQDDQEVQDAAPPELDLMDFLQAGAIPFGSWFPEADQDENSTDLGFLVTDDSLNEPQAWSANFSAGYTQPWG
jgi:hypothetical protein